MLTKLYSAYVHSAKYVYVQCTQAVNNLCFMLSPISCTMYNVHTYYIHLFYLTMLLLSQENRKVKISIGSSLFSSSSEFEVSLKGRFKEQTFYQFNSLFIHPHTYGFKEQTFYTNSTAYFSSAYLRV